MPSGEDVEIAEPADFLALLVALFLAALLLAALFLVRLRALTFLLFFTRLPSSFENLVACESPANTSYSLSMLPWIAALDPMRAD
jgi:hypothetical protein